MSSYHFCVLFNQANLSQQQTNPKVDDSSGYCTNLFSTSSNADEGDKVTRKKIVETITPADRLGIRNVGKDCALS